MIMLTPTLFSGADFRKNVYLEQVYIFKYAETSCQFQLPEITVPVIMN